MFDIVVAFVMDPLDVIVQRLKCRGDVTAERTVVYLRLFFFRNPIHAFFITFLNVSQMSLLCVFPRRSSR